MPCRADAPHVTRGRTRTRRGSTTTHASIHARITRRCYPCTRRSLPTRSPTTAVRARALLVCRNQSSAALRVVMRGCAMRARAPRASAPSPCISSRSPATPHHARVHARIDACREYVIDIARHTAISAPLSYTSVSGAHTALRTVTLAGYAQPEASAPRSRGLAGHDRFTVRVTRVRSCPCSAYVHPLGPTAHGACLCAWNDLPVDC